MGLFNKFFGGGDPLAALNRAVRRQQWADVLRDGSSIDRDNLPAHLVDEFDSLLELAGNRLAEINLAEGEACQRSGEIERAHEHYSLAVQYARSEELIRRAEQLDRDIQNVSVDIKGPAVVTNSCCAGGCGSEKPNDEASEDESEAWDLETQLELVLPSYPPEWAVRYSGSGIEFKRALLLSHEGHLEEALNEFETVPATSRDDLFYFERGSLRGRMNDHVQSRIDLERAVELNPSHELALEMLVTLDLNSRNMSGAETRLESMLSSGIAPGFCYSRLAMISAARDDESSAMAYGEKALAVGPVDLETLVLQSRLLEKNGRLDQAEALLSTIPAGGCGGGAHFLLAEFWLRQGKYLEKALESFKGAGRQDPANPRWPMRIAQTYLALGWHKEGHAMMMKLLSTSELDEHIRHEAEEILVFYGK